METDLGQQGPNQAPNYFCASLGSRSIHPPRWVHEGGQAGCGIETTPMLEFTAAFRFFGRHYASSGKHRVYFSLTFSYVFISPVLARVLGQPTKTVDHLKKSTSTQIFFFFPRNKQSPVESPNLHSHIVAPKCCMGATYDVQALLLHEYQVYDRGCPLQVGKRQKS